MEIKKPFVKKLFPTRDKWSRKGDFGHLLIIGGSKLYSGSPAFAALAALKTGTDLVTVFAPKRAADIIATFSPDLITYPARGDFLNSWNLGEALRFLKKADAVVIGGGVGKRKETAAFVEKFLERNDKPCVIDADGIHVIANNERLLGESCILTPHAHEFFLLTGRHPTDNLKERQGMVQRYAKKLGCTILLKGSVDMISDGKKVAVNKTGTPLMTKGGTGDTLAGICGGLLARRANPFDAAAAAAWINGSAGELAGKEFGESLMAENILEEIHAVLKWGF